MRRTAVLAFGAASLAAGGALAQPPGAVARFDDIGPALLACWKPPVGSDGMEITLVFSVSRSGAILGRPKISYAKLFGANETQRRFVASALLALARCTPLALSAQLGGAIAGHPIAMLFRAAPARSAV